MRVGAGVGDYQRYFWTRVATNFDTGQGLVTLVEFCITLLLIFHLVRAQKCSASRTDPSMKDNLQLEEGARWDSGDRSHPRQAHHLYVLPRLTKTWLTRCMM